MSKIAVLLFAQAGWAITVPSGTTIQIRLRQEVNSYSTDKGSIVRGIVTAPVTVNGKIAIPRETRVHGVVEDVQRVGLGLRRERATLHLRFHELEFPDQRRVQISGVVSHLENAREAVDKQGMIRGIRSTATPGYKGAGFLTTLAAVDPIALLFTSAAFATMLRFSEPEIVLPAGADLEITLLAPVESREPWPDLEPRLIATEGQAAALRDLVRALPYRTRTRAGDRESDLTNLVFLGGRSALKRAFHAAGWVETAESTTYSKFRAFRAYAENQGFQEAPMSDLLLNGSSPVLNLSKSLNTFAKRHHLRIFDSEQGWKDESGEGWQALTASSTHDIGIFFSRQKKLVHRIDENIDIERGKVVNDLMLTGCVEWVETVERPWVPKTSSNASGDRLVTDGKIAVVHLNDCQAPKRFDEAVAERPGPFHGNRASRIGRQAILTIRNDLLRGNLGYTGYSGIRWLQRSLKNRPPLDPVDECNAGKSVCDSMPGADSGGPGVSAVETRLLPIGARSLLPVKQPRGPSLHVWEPARIELSVRIGGFKFGGSTAGPEGLIIARKAPGSGPPYTFTTDNRVESGWSIGGAVTLHSHRWVSHELGYQYQRGAFRLGLMSVDMDGHEMAVSGLEEQRVGLVARQVSYNTLIHLRPPEKRLRPYFAVGPGLRLVNLTDAPFKKARGIFRFGLNNVGMLRAAYDFGSAPPLEGGGIFQPVAQVGAGFRVRLQPRCTFIVDYRNSLSRPLDFLSKSLRRGDPGLFLGELPFSNLSSPFRGRLQQHRFSTGFSFTF